MLIRLLLVAVYLGVPAIPIAFVIFGNLPDRLLGRPMMDDIGSMIAMIGFSIICLEFLVIGRYRQLSSRFGCDAIMRTHQLFARTATVFAIGWDCLDRINRINCIGCAQARAEHELRSLAILACNRRAFNSCVWTAPHTRRRALRIAITCPIFLVVPFYNCTRFISYDLFDSPDSAARQRLSRGDSCEAR